MKKIKISELTVQSNLNEGDRLLAYSNQNVMRLSWRMILDKLPINPRNYIQGSRLDNLSGWVTGGGSPSIVDTPDLGDVVQWSRSSGSGGYQKQFTVTQIEKLAGKRLLFFVLAKKISESGKFSFGGWPETSNELTSDNSNKIDMGLNWILHWRSFTSGSTISSQNTFGLNSITGTWQFYCVGINIGTRYAGWQRAWED